MKVNLKQAKFVLSATLFSQRPKDVSSEVAFVGRSNVGKSSLINALCHQKQLAKTSQTPGCTQLCNYFSAGEGAYLVDLPGVGYAKTSQWIKSQFSARLSEYILSDNPACAAICLLVDGRHIGLPLDISLYEWIQSNDKEVIIVVTKIDKLRQKERQTLPSRLQHAFGTTNAFATASRNGAGIAPLRSYLESLLKTH